MGALFSSSPCASVNVGDHFPATNSGRWFAMPTPAWTPRAVRPESGSPPSVDGCAGSHWTSFPSWPTSRAARWSFVGPRPPLPSHLPRYSPEQLRRFDVRPGLTGLAQINGRNRLLWSHRIAYDLEYVRMHSLGLDLRIVLRTFGVVLSGRGLALDRNPDEVDDLPRDAVSPPGPHQCEVLPPGPPRSAVP